MKFVKESVIRATPERVWAFHELPDALERLMPPLEHARIIKRVHISQVGQEAIIETKIFGLLPIKWVARHTLYRPPHEFEDVQVSGPFKRWRHRHIIEPHTRGAILRDEVEYELPFGLLGILAAPLLIVPKLERMFDYRHRTTRRWCETTVAEGGTPTDK